MSEQRKYSIAEIDQMRGLIRAREFSGRGGGYASSSSLDTEMRIAVIRARETQVVEEMLRTYMLAGIGPDELVAAA